MATYKVIQDIEADDKFVGPLTLKQFVFAMAGAFFAYLSFFAITAGFAYALIVLVPPMLLGFFLAIPWSKHQPTEVWVLAKLRFFFKPRKRTWDQSGIEELVTITVPKKEEKQLTDNLEQDEVRSRLKALATTIDSRGWAVKDLQAQQVQTTQPTNQGDRLVSADMLPKQTPIENTDNITDPYTSPTEASQNFDRMIQQSEDTHRDHTLEMMDQVRSGKQPTSADQPVIAPLPGNNAEEEHLSKELKKRSAPNSLATKHMRTINPGGHKKKTKHKKEQPKNNEKAHKTPPEPKQSPAILEYAGNNDLNVATIARQADKDTKGDPDEVVISLH